MKKLIEKYNQSKTVLVVSSYPDKKDGIKNLNAVAWYAEKTLKSLPLGNKYRIVVLAEITDKPQTYEDGRLLIIRCWRRNSPFLLKDLLSQIIKFDKVANVLVEFEFNTFGGMIGTFAFPFFMLALKVLGKRTVLELHQVLLDINALSGHLNIKRGGLLASILNLVLMYFYKSVGRLSDRIIVLEEELKNRLSTFVEPKKITPLFIATSKKNLPSKENAREKLGLKKNDFILLYFGFVTWYKGADWLIKECKGKNVKLIVAGGSSPTLRKKSHYQKFYSRILSLVEKSPNISLTGFVNEADIPYYFAACDLVVLPYRAFMSASGPLSFAISYRKPFILSNNLSCYLGSEDFVESLDIVKGTKEDLVFPLDSYSFNQKIKTLKSDPLALKKLQKISSNLNYMRSPENLGKMYFKELIDVSRPTYRYSPSSLLAKLLARGLAYRLG
ncbi:MAG: glycosyltransferase [bacterium]|nr:glycosyltransferase [bacterium]